MVDARRSLRERRQTERFNPSVPEKPQSKATQAKAKDQGDEGFRLAVKEGSAEWYRRRNMNLNTYNDEWERNSGWTLRDSARNEERERRRREGITSIYEPFIPTRKLHIPEQSTSSPDAVPTDGRSDGLPKVVFDAAYFQEFDTNSDSLGRNNRPLNEALDREEKLRKQLADEQEARARVASHNPPTTVSTTRNAASTKARITDTSSNQSSHPHLRNPTKPVDRFNIRYFKKRKPMSFYVQQAANHKSSRSSQAHESVPYTSDEERSGEKGKHPVAGTRVKVAETARVRPSEERALLIKELQSVAVMALATPEREILNPSLRPTAKPMPKKPVARRGRPKKKGKKPVTRTENNSGDSSASLVDDIRPAAQHAEDVANAPTPTSEGRPKNLDAAAISVSNIMDGLIDIDQIMDPEVLRATPESRYLFRRVQNSPGTLREGLRGRSKMIPAAPEAKEPSRSKSTTKRARQVSRTLLHDDNGERESTPETKKARARADYVVTPIPTASRGVDHPSKGLSTPRSITERPSPAFPSSASLLGPAKAGKSHLAEANSSPTADRVNILSSQGQKGPPIGRLFPPPPSPKTSPGRSATISRSFESPRKTTAEIMAANAKAREEDLKQGVDISSIMRALR